MGYTVHSGTGRKVVGHGSGSLSGISLPDCGKACDASFMTPPPITYGGHLMELPKLWMHSDPAPNLKSSLSGSAPHAEIAC